jgi:hypothetical protein
MKKTLLIIFILTFIPFASHADYYDDSRKITKIKAVILVCDRTMSPSNADNECDDYYLGEYINKSPIKFITRKNLRDLLNEQTLSQSALTKEKVAEFGKLYSASHILFYKRNEPLLEYVLFRYKFILVNTSTSEIEYTTEVYEYTEDYKKKNRDPVFGFSPGGDMYRFFDLLNVNSAVNPAEKAPWRK